MLRSLKKWSGKLFVTVGLFLILGLTLGSLGIEGLSKLEQYWNSASMSVTLLSYGFYIYVALNWPKCCHWVAKQVSNENDINMLAIQIQSKKYLVITVVVFFEILSWTSRLSS